MAGFAGYVKRISISVKAYKARVPQHDEHLYTWRAWIFKQEYLPRKKKGKAQ